VGWSPGRETKLEEFADLIVDFDRSYPVPEKEGAYEFRHLVFQAALVGIKKWDCKSAQASGEDQMM
jgi:hypothetical protein